MACPFFVPERRLGSAGWAIPPRYPLGDAYAGRCVAPCAPDRLPEERQASLCNFGYAKGQCDCFPNDGAADAVRFSVSGERLIFVYEIEHAPVSHGVIEPDAVPGDDSPLAAQARAFLASFERRRNRRP